MEFYRDEILKISEELSMDIYELTHVEVSELNSRLRKYIDNNIKSPFLWEKIKSCKSFCDPSAWERLSDFVAEGRVILFLQYQYRMYCFEFEKIDEVVTLLKETTGFEFYITNRETDYLVCNNHHDYLIIATK